MSEDEEETNRMVTHYSTLSHTNSLFSLLSCPVLSSTVLCYAVCCALLHFAVVQVMGIWPPGADGTDVNALDVLESKVCVVCQLESLRIE